MQHNHFGKIYEVVETTPASRTSKGYQQLTGLTTTAQGLPNLPVGAHIARIIPEGNDVRMRDDGTDPTASVGMPLQKDVEYFYAGDLSTLKFIAKTGTSILNVTYYT